MMSAPNISPGSTVKFRFPLRTRLGDALNASRKSARHLNQSPVPSGKLTVNSCPIKNGDFTYCSSVSLPEGMLEKHWIVHL